MQILQHCASFDPDELKSSHFQVQAKNPSVWDHKLPRPSSAANRGFGDIKIDSNCLQWLSTHVDEMNSYLFSWEATRRNNLFIETAVAWWYDSALHPGWGLFVESTQMRGPWKSVLHHDDLAIILDKKWILHHNHGLSVRFFAKKQDWF